MAAASGIHVLRPAFALSEKLMEAAEQVGQLQGRVSDNFEIALTGCRPEVAG